MNTRWLLLLLLAAAVPAQGAEAPPTMAALENEFTAVAARALPGVCSVQPGEPAAARMELPPNAPFGNGNPPARIFTHVLGAGTQPTTGFAWDREGHVVTAGLRQGETKARVTLPGRGVVDAKVLGQDAATGLSVLLVPGETTPLPVGDSATVKPGAWAITLAGGDSAPGAYTGNIAAINDAAPGDQGGPLFRVAGVPTTGSAGAPVLNLRGEVIGIIVPRNRAGGLGGQATVFFSVNGVAGTNQAGEGLGVGVAVAINAARGIIDQLKAGQAVKRGYLGLRLSDLTPELAKLAGLQPGAGAFVQDVVPGGPAEAAGIKPEDVILSVDGRPAKSAAELSAMARALPAGKEVQVALSRKGQRMEVALVLGNAPEQPAAELPAGAGLLRVLPEIRIDGGGALQIGPGLGQPLQINPPAIGGAANLERPVTVDVKADNLADAVVQALNGTGLGFRIAPEVLAEQGNAHHNFAMNTVNTPLRQVLEMLANGFGLRYRLEGNVVVFEKKGQ